MPITVPNPYAVDVAGSRPTRIDGLQAAPETGLDQSSLVGGVVRASSDFDKAMQKWQFEIDKTRAQDAANQLNSAMLGLKYGDGQGKGGWVNALGKNALERESGKSLEQENQESFKATFDEIRKGLGNGRQRAMLDTVYNGMNASMSQDIAAHVTKQFNVYQDSVDQDSLDQAFKMSKSTDPTLRKSGLEASRAIVRKICERRGLPVDYSKGPGVIHSMAIEDMVDSGQTAMARRYLRENMGEMSSRQIEEAESLFKAGEDAEHVDAYTQNILENSASLQEAMTRLGGVDVRYRDKVRTKVRQHFTDLQAMLNEQNRENKTLAWQYIVSGEQIPTTLVEAITRNDPKTMATIQRYLSSKSVGGVKVNDAGLFRQLDDMATRDPDTFRRLDMMDYADKLTTGTINSFIKRQSEVGRTQREDFIKAAKETARIEEVKASDIPFVSEAASRKWDEWSASHNGALPNDAEQKQLIRGLFSGEKKGWFFDRKQPQWKAMHENPNVAVADLEAQTDWRSSVDDETLQRYCIDNLGVNVADLNSEQRRAANSLYAGLGWPKDIWEKASNRTKELAKERPGAVADQRAIEMVAKAMVFEGFK